MGRPTRLYPDGPVAIGLVNEGGGTRKTTDAVNLGVAITRRNVKGKKRKKVAILDADQTMQASAYLGYGLADRDPTGKSPEEIDRIERVYERLAKMPNVSDVLYNRLSLQDVLLPARTRISEGDEDENFAIIENLWLVLGSRDMAFASEDLSRRADCDTMWLRRALTNLPPGLIDVLIVDFRGTHLQLEESMLAGLDYVIGAVKPDYKDISTLGILTTGIEKAQRQFEFSGGAADLRHVLINGIMPKQRGKFYAELGDMMVQRYGSLLLRSKPDKGADGQGEPCMISENVQIAESVAAQEPVHFWEPGGKAAKEFDQAAAALDLVWED